MVHQLIRNYRKLNYLLVLSRRILCDFIQGVGEVMFMAGLEGLKIETVEVVKQAPLIPKNEARYYGNKKLKEFSKTS